MGYCSAVKKKEEVIYVPIWSRGVGWRGECSIKEGSLEVLELCRYGHGEECCRLCEQHVQRLWAGEEFGTTENPRDHCYWSIVSEGWGEWCKIWLDRPANMCMQGFAGHVKIVWKFLKKEAGDLLLFKMKKTARECCFHHMWGKAAQVLKIYIFWSASGTEFLTWADTQVNWIRKGDKMGHRNSFSLGRAQEEQVLP